MVELDMTVGRETLEEQRRAEHKCIECGKDLLKNEINQRMIRCTSCRKARVQIEEMRLEKRRQRAEQIKAEKVQAEKAMARYARQAEKCRACYWATAHDGIIFCPSIKGTCLRKEIGGFPAQDAKEQEL